MQRNRPRLRMGPFHGLIVANRRWLRYALGVMLLFVGVIILASKLQAWM